jgi:hypothetical protein
MGPCLKDRVWGVGTVVWGNGNVENQEAEAEGMLCKPKKAALLNLHAG